MQYSQRYLEPGARRPNTRTSDQNYATHRRDYDDEQQFAESSRQRYNPPETQFGPYREPDYFRATYPYEQGYRPSGDQSYYANEYGYGRQRHPQEFSQRGYGYEEGYYSQQPDRPESYSDWQSGQPSWQGSQSTRQSGQPSGQGRQSNWQTGQPSRQGRQPSWQSERSDWQTPYQTSNPYEDRYERGSAATYGSVYPAYGAHTGTSGPYEGIGPRGFRRSKERLTERVCERLEQMGSLDASQIEVQVDDDGEVTLSGNVNSRQDKRNAEDCVESVYGVKDVHNHLKCNGGTDSPRQFQSSGNGQGQRSQTASDESQRKSPKTTNT